MTACVCCHPVSLHPLSFGEQAACLPARLPAPCCSPSSSAPPAASGALWISRKPSRLTTTATGAAACSGASPACPLLPALHDSAVLLWGKHPPLLAACNTICRGPISPTAQSTMPAGLPSPAARRRCPRMSRWGVTMQPAASTGRAREATMSWRRVQRLVGPRREMLASSWDSTDPLQQLGH